MIEPKNLTAGEVLAFQSGFDVENRSDGLTSITNANRKAKVIEVLERPMSDAMLSQLESMLGIDRSEPD